jgi:hypothetical protein
VIVIIILLHLISKCKEQNELLKNSQWELVEKLAISQKLLLEKNGEIAELNRLNDSLICENSILREALNDCVNSQKSMENFLMKELSSIRKEISALCEKVDSLEGGFDVQNSEMPCDTISGSSTDSDTTHTSSFITKKLSFVVTKKTFNKKEKVLLNTNNILNYSSNLLFTSETGFSKDSICATYTYMNENSDSVQFMFRSVIRKESLYLDIRKNKTTVLFFEDKKFDVGAGGLLKELDEPLNWEWQHQYLEKLEDAQLKKKGLWEIIFGTAIAGAGGYGLWYFENNPEAIINFRDSNGLIQSIKIPNTFGKVISGGAIGFGTGLTLKGFIDRGLSMQVRPAEISIIYKIN